MDIKFIDDKSHGFNAYDVLGIDPKSTMSEIKSAYKKMLVQYHPDKNIQSHQSVVDYTTEKFLTLQKAWGLLSTPENRKIYDDLLKSDDTCVVSEEFPIVDFTLTPDETCYRKACRCGDTYEVSNDAKCFSCLLSLTKSLLSFLCYRFLLMIF